MSPIARPTFSAGASKANPEGWTCSGSHGRSFPQGRSPIALALLPSGIYRASRSPTVYGLISCEKIFPFSSPPSFIILSNLTFAYSTDRSRILSTSIQRLINRHLPELGDSNKIPRFQINFRLLG